MKGVKAKQEFFGSEVQGCQKEKDVQFIIAEYPEHRAGERLRAWTLYPALSSFQPLDVCLKKHVSLFETLPNKTTPIPNH